MVDFKELHRGTKICPSHDPLGTKLWKISVNARKMR